MVRSSNTTLFAQTNAFTGRIAMVMGAKKHHDDGNAAWPLDRA
jgi:hypothetical protein